MAQGIQQFSAPGLVQNAQQVGANNRSMRLQDLTAEQQQIENREQDMTQAANEARAFVQTFAGQLPANKSRQEMSQQEMDRAFSTAKQAVADMGGDIQGVPDQYDEQSLKKINSIARLADSESGNKVGAREILPDGTVIQSTPQGPRVFAPSGDRLYGEDARQQVKDARNYGARIQGRRAQLRAGGKSEQEEAQEALEEIGRAEKLVGLYDQGIEALQDGAVTGRVESLAPTIREETLRLQDVQRRLGLDVLKNTSFGNLSNQERQFALKAALNTDLPTDELLDQLRRKREAQIKMMRELEKAAEFRARADTTKSDWIRYKNKLEQGISPDPDTFGKGADQGGSQQDAQAQPSQPAQQQSGSGQPQSSGQQQGSQQGGGQPQGQGSNVQSLSDEELLDSL